MLLDTAFQNPFLFAQPSKISVHFAFVLLCSAAGLAFGTKFTEEEKLAVRVFMPSLGSA